ncbi:thioesterase family protein [Bowmanella denitrificans]|uniref:Thioesterase family protein n=1 Tax=Bowmanella denitrificans TaxID=366582 RepID=A0ABN0XVE8_9ALTE|nr:thioesterase family protein [Bowmanella denitrificans]
MLSQEYDVRFYETDALRHVSNTVLAGWFEAAREPIFRLFSPELDLTNWPLILASYKIDFLRQIFYGKPVQVRTGISRIGKSSFDVYQEIWQDEQQCATGITTMVHFDYATQSSKAISEQVRSELIKLSTEAA